MLPHSPIKRVGRRRSPLAKPPPTDMGKKGANKAKAKTTTQVKGDDNASTMRLVLRALVLKFLSMVFKIIKSRILTNPIIKRLGWSTPEVMDWDKLLRESDRNPWHILYTPSYDDLEVVIHGRSGKKLNCFIMLNIGNSKLCHPNDHNKFIDFPGHLFKGRPHISLTSCAQGWQFDSYESKHHYDMKCEQLLGSIRSQDVWGELFISRDMNVMKVADTSKLFALATLLQEQLGSGEKYRNLHVSLAKPLQ
jgi:hypothetical protein